MTENVLSVMALVVELITSSVQVLTIAKSVVYVVAPVSVRNVRGPGVWSGNRLVLGNEAIEDFAGLVGRGGGGG